MLGKVKAAKRRATQQVREKLGAEKTVDVEFNSKAEEFNELSDELMLIGAHTKAYLDATKAWCDASVQLHSSLAKYYEGQPGGISQPVQQALEAHEHINMLRRSMAQVFVDSALDPMRDLCGEKLPDIQSRMRERQNYLRDYDSYRRQHKAMKESEKKTKLGETLDQARQTYDQSNTGLKQDFDELLSTRHDLLLPQASAIMACQAEFCKQTSSKLQEVTAKFPDEPVAQARKAIQLNVSKGGPTVAAPQQSQAQAEARPAAAPRFPKKASPAPKAIRARALYEYECQEAGELGFKVGDIITVTKQEEGWWEGTCNNQTGVFPANYVEVVV